MPSISLDSAAGVLLKPFAGGSSARSINLPSSICSTMERFRAGTPGATTIVSVALELPLTPAKDGVVAGCVPPEKAADRMADVVDVEERAVLLIGRHSEGNEPVVGKLLSPKFPKMLLEGMVPSPPPVVPACGRGPAVNTASRFWKQAIDTHRL